MAPGNIKTIQADYIWKDIDQSERIMECQTPSVWELLKVEAMSDQENRVHSVEWAEPLVWAQAMKTEGRDEKW